MSEKEFDKRVEEYLKIGRESSAIALTDRKTGKVVNVIRFARATMDDWTEIKGLSTEELKRRYIGLCVCMEFSVSVRDCEFEGLMAMELSRRKVGYSEVKGRIKRGIKKAQAILGEKE